MDKRNLRVYMAIETFLPLVGGSERQALLQSKYLRAQGIDITIITMRFQQDWPACDELDGVPVLRIAGSVLAWHERFSGSLRRLCYLFALLTLGWQLWKRRHDYELLHVFQLTLFTLPALVVCRLARKSLVVSMRCDSLPGKRDQRNQDKRARSWADLDGLARLGKPALRLIDHQLERCQAPILILSAHMRESLNQCGLNGARALLIPNGVDSQQFCPCPWEEKEALTVICVAKMRYQKGVDVLLRAWRRVLKQMPQARLRLVGDGPQFEALRCLAGELGVTSSVEFAGLCTDVPQQLRRARIAVLPSRWEGMPNALLEAMACGLACIATRVSGNKDVIEHGINGLLAEPENPAVLAEALLLLLKNEELCRHYGRAARRHIEQYYVFEELMNRHMELYMDCLHGKTSSSLL